MILACSSGLLAFDTRTILPEDILKMSFEEMLNIKITTAGKKEERIADIPASAVIITRHDIEKYGYMNLEEILENVPGMFVIDDFSGYRKTYGVRGFYAGYPRNIIFMVNGVSQVESVFDYNVMSNFNIPVEAIDRIEVVRGPMSVIYGQGAFFGAINIITNDMGDDTSLVSFSAGKGTEKVATKVTGSQGDFNFSFSAGFSDSDGPDHELQKLVSDMSSLNMWGINETNNTTEDRLERDSKNFIFSGAYNYFYADMSFNQSHDEVFVYRPSITSGSPYDRKMAKITLGYKDQLTDNIKINAKLSYHSFSFTLDWDITSSFFSGNDAGETRGESNFFEYELDAFIEISEKLHLTTGLYYKESKDTLFAGEMPIFNVSFKTNALDDIDLWATFAQLNYSPWEKLRLVSGLRIEQMKAYTIVHDNNPGDETFNRIQGTYGKDDIELIPSLAAIYSFNDKNIVKFLYGESLARPSFFQNRDQLESGYPDLDPEEIHTFEVNYIFTPSSKVMINCSVFHNVLDNLIVRTILTEGDDLTSYFSNGGKLLTNGVELSIQAKPFDKFFTELSLTYQDTEDQRDGFEDIDVAYSPHLLGYLKMSYALRNNITLALTGTYVDEMETEWDVQLNNYTGGRIGKPVDSHFLIGANLRVNDLFGKGCFLNVRGSNILDKEYHYPTYVNNTWADKGTLGDPMHFLVTLGKKF